MDSKHNNPQVENIRLLPFDLKNEQFNLNLAAFNQFRPELAAQINQYTPTHYQICLNSDDSINIYDHKLGSILLPTTQAEINTYFENCVNNIQFTVRPNNIHQLDTPLSRRLNTRRPLIAALHNTLLESSHFKENKSIRRDSINFIPLLRAYGINLGYHLLFTLQKYDVATLVIHEPNFDLFYTSLYTTPWNNILETFETDPHRHYFLQIGNANSSIDSEIQFLEKQHPFFANCQAKLFGSLDQNFEDLVSHENQYDSNHSMEITGGCYEDQFNGFKNAVKNLNLNAPIYNGKKTQSKLPIFIVGSGPSLDASLSYLSKHKDEAIIIACGSSLSVLIKNNIVPDIHLLQERYDNDELLLQYASHEDFKKIICIKLNVVAPDIDYLYREVLLLQKANDPGSTLLPSDLYPHSYHVTPTVTNLGVVLCSLLGAKKVFLFGLDYGSSENFSKRHAKDTLVQFDDSVKKNFKLSIESVDSKKVFTNESFLLSKKMTEIVILATQESQWLNVGEGAKIAGTRSIYAKDLPSKLQQSGNKAGVLSDLKQLFNNHYSIESIFNDINNKHIPASQDYLLALIECFDTIPQSRTEMMSTFTLISQAAQVGEFEDNYLPKKLFSLEFMSFLNNLYVLVSTTSSDQEAILLYQQSIATFKEHLEIIYQDFIATMTNINTQKPSPRAH